MRSAFLTLVVSTALAPMLARAGMVTNISVVMTTGINSDIINVQTCNTSPCYLGSYGYLDGEYHAGGPELWVEASGFQFWVKTGGSLSEPWLVWTDLEGSVEATISETAEVWRRDIGYISVNAHGVMRTCGTFWAGCGPGSADSFTVTIDGAPFMVQPEDTWPSYTYNFSTGLVPVTFGDTIPIEIHAAIVPRLDPGEFVERWLTMDSYSVNFFNKSGGPLGPVPAPEPFTTGLVGFGAMLALLASRSGRSR